MNSNENSLNRLKEGRVTSAVESGVPAFKVNGGVELPMKECKAYEIVKQQRIEDIHADGYLLCHKKSGARVMILKNEDDNKVFNIAFRTPPADSTGVAHILEHSVLCGSRQFPLKDPFVELVKGSLNTFLNAMTYPDKTMYPVASCNDQDFQNLMHVYLDAVFYPNIYEKEEIFRQEGWNYQLEDLDAPLKYNGVVYNEMKGAFSSPDEILQREIFDVLFPDTPYGVESGGDPRKIPDLTYENFLTFHSKYYHPSNSYIYLYGNMDVEEKLNWLDQEYLSKFERIPVDSQIPYQKPFEKPLEHIVYYPVAEGGSEEENTYLTYNTVVGNSLDVELCTAFEVLDYVLLSAPGAPLRQALLDAGLGKDVQGGYDDGILQPFFSVIVKNGEEKDKEKFVQVIRDTLSEIVKEGINQKAVAAGINFLEFRFREADYSSFPRGLMYGIDVFDSWLYDDEKPFIHLERLGAFDSLKEKASQGYFENLIQTYLLDNPHTALVLGVPKKGMALEEEKQLEEKLAAYKESCTREQLEEMVEKTRRLQQFQESEDSEEAKARIPMLKRSDIKTETVKLYNTPHMVHGRTVLHHDVDTNGITYMSLLFDTARVPDELVPYMGILKSVLGYVDTAHYTYGELFHEINAQSGGINCGLQVFTPPKEQDDCRRMFGVRAKYLKEKEGFVFSMIREILFTSKLEDDRRLYEILTRQKARLEVSLGEAGHSTAVMRSASYYSPASNFQDRVAGIGYFRLLEDLEKNFEEKKEDLKKKLQQLIFTIFRSENLLVSITTDKEGYEGFEGQLALLIPLLYKNPVETGQIHYDLLQKNEGFTTAGQVQYAAVGGNFRKADFEYTGALRILKVILSYDYLWINIRVKGGAYGCMSNFRRTGDSFLVSYRDPHLKQTLDVFRGTPEYLRNFQADEREMTKYIIGTISELDVPMNPSAQGELALTAWLSDLGEEDFQKERDEILKADQEDIRRLADLIQAVLDQEIICVVGSESSLEKNREILKTVEPLNN